MKTGPGLGDRTESTGRRGHAHTAHGKLRKYQRYAVDTRIAVSHPGHRRPFHGRTLGISEAGMAALLAVNMEVGETVGLEFSLPSCPQPLAVRAVVRNRTGARYGFEFLTLSQQQRTAITKFCLGQAEQ